MICYDYCFTSLIFHFFVVWHCKAASWWLQPKVIFYLLNILCWRSSILQKWKLLSPPCPDCFIVVLFCFNTKIFLNDHQNCEPYFVPPKELPKQYFGSCTSIDLRAVLFSKSKEHIIRVIKEVRYGIGKSKPNSGLYLQVMEIQFPW